MTVRPVSLWIMLLTLLSARLIGWEDAWILILGAKCGIKKESNLKQKLHNHFARAEKSALRVFWRCQYFGMKHNPSCGGGGCRFPSSPPLISILLPAWKVSHAGGSPTEGKESERSDTKGPQLVFLSQTGAFLCGQTHRKVLLNLSGFLFKVTVQPSSSALFQNQL